MEACAVLCDSSLPPPSPPESLYRFSGNRIGRIPMKRKIIKRTDRIRYGLCCIVSASFSSDSVFENGVLNDSMFVYTDRRTIPARKKHNNHDWQICYPAERRQGGGKKKFAQHRAENTLRRRITRASTSPHANRGLICWRA